MANTSSKSIQEYMNMGQEDYLKNRLEDQIKWMDGKSSSNKKSYQRMKLLVIILSVSIPFFVLLIDDFPYFKYIVGGVGVMIAATEGVLSLFEYQNNWLNYRKTLESLNREKFLFATKSGIYMKNNSFQFFVERIESILEVENKSWSEFSMSQVEVSNGA